MLSDEIALLVDFRKGFTRFLVDKCKIDGKNFVVSECVYDHSVMGVFTKDDGKLLGVLMMVVGKSLRQRDEHGFVEIYKKIIY